MVTSGFGFGKTILVGEHFVVYGLPAIVAGLNKKTVCRIEKSGEYECIDNRPQTPGYKKEKFEQQQKAHELIFAKLNIDIEKTPFKLILEGDLVATSGVGASAADCVAIARALNGYFKLNLNDEQINETGFEGEKGYHGTPSGIDNTAATYGGTIWFKKGTPPVMEPIKTKLRLPIVLINTGKTSDTAAVVADVRKLKEQKPEWFDEILKQYEQLAMKTKLALEQNDLQAVANCLNQNQELLQQITVSNSELDAIVSEAKKAGALAAKLTGTGRGGLAIALAKDSAGQEKIASAVQKMGYETERTTIG